MWKMRNAHCRTWSMGRNTQKRGKLEIHTIGHGIWHKKIWKTWRMREKHCRAWNMGRKLKITENEKHIVGSEIWQETLKNMKKKEMHTVGPRVWWENWKSWKMTKIHCRKWNMARNTEMGGKWEIHTVWSGIWQE